MEVFVDINNGIGYRIMFHGESYTHDTLWDAVSDFIQKTMFAAGYFGDIPKFDYFAEEHCGRLKVFVEFEEDFYE